MVINDRIYGKIDIKEQIIIELINSKPFQRLKKISQDGAVHFIQPVRNVNRYEHSIGVWYLSKKYNRPIEEQIASLLHDLPHTAFSHVADYVFGDEKHEFHEKFTEKIIRDSEIPAILKKNDIDIDKVLESEDYELLENDLPDISVDRWDYFMRDGYTLGFLPGSVIENFLSEIYLDGKTLYFKDKRLAALYAVMYVNFCRLIWADPTSHSSFFLLAGALRTALDKKYIDQADLFTNDEVLMEKIKSVKDPDIDSFLERLRPGKEFVYADKNTADFYGPNKVRFVDPYVMTGDGLNRVSELVPSLGYFFKEFSEKYKVLGVKQIN